MIFVKTMFSGSLFGNEWSEPRHCLKWVVADLWNIKWKVLIDYRYYPAGFPLLFSPDCQGCDAACNHEFALELFLVDWDENGTNDIIWSITKCLLVLHLILFPWLFPLLRNFVWIKDIRTNWNCFPWKTHSLRYPFWTAAQTGGKVLYN